MIYVRLSDMTPAQSWLAQFTTPDDRNNAKNLLNSLKYVSNREFEEAINYQLLNLQNRLDTTLAVYPVISPPVDGIRGSDLFTGNYLDSEISKPNKKQKVADGRRFTYGSEDRVGHILERICDSQRGSRQHSKIECTPTLKTLKAQGIKHVVLVDDICGSGKRIVDFYKKVLPKSLKRQISLGKVSLWIVFYVVNSSGIRYLKSSIKYFQKHANQILIAFPELNISIINTDIQRLCLKYSKRIYGDDSDAIGLGYEDSIGGVIFEHGCPNNLPEILWKNNKQWNAIFKNRAVPSELKSAFDRNSTAEIGEVLWNSGQYYLALSLYDAIDKGCLSVDEHLLIAVLGLLMRQVASESIAGRLMIEHARYQLLIREAYEKGLLEPQGSQSQLKVSAFGKALVERFRARKNKKISIASIDDQAEYYYPTQCDGHLQYSGSLLSESKESSTD